MVKNFKKLFRSYRGRNFLSRWARKIFEQPKIKKIFGFNLAAVVLLAGIFEPQAELILSKQKISSLSSENFPVIETKTKTTLSWPIKNPEISQRFHFGHWGIDIVDKKNKDVYPIDEGVILKVIRSKWGYGKHIIIEHPNNRRSLYAHFEKIKVKKGDIVSRETVLGIEGRSGWSSGVHLHLEIFQDGKRINPFLVLPKKLSF